MVIWTLSITKLLLNGDRIRVPYPFQWGAPSFDAGESFAMMAASFVALVEVRFFVFVISISIL